MAKEVRFLQNFLMDIVSTTLDGDGNLIVTDIKVAIHYGEIYALENYAIAGNSVSLTFASGNPFQGTAPNVERGYCEIKDSAPPPPASVATGGVVFTGGGGGGGCGCGK